MWWKRTQGGIQLISASSTKAINIRKGIQEVRLESPSMNVIEKKMRRVDEQEDRTRDPWMGMKLVGVYVCNRKFFLQLIQLPKFHLLICQACRAASGQHHLLQSTGLQNVIYHFGLVLVFWWTVLNVLTAGSVTDKSWFSPSSFSSVPLFTG